MIRTSLRQLEYFEALSETLHFGRAATLCGVTQPALSTQVAELEDVLGCRLFNRARRAVSLTEEGRSLLPQARTILDAARAFESTARQQPTMQGRFRLGLIPTIAPYLLPPLLPALRQAFPDFQLELREALTPHLTGALLAGEIDAFIAALPIDERQVTALPLFEESFFLAVPAADPDFVAPPVPPDSPALERLMLLEEGHCLREQALSVCTQVKPVAMKRFGATSLFTLMQMVANGMGVTLIPEMAVATAQSIGGLKVVPFAAPAPQRNLALFARRNGIRFQECEMLAEATRRIWLSPPDVA
ncbi:hydrogen peroxide-inducible genes activator [Tianweitania sediminis]|uniref:Hydrogen peroxide-inducible genes activator n=1 Tax=Tianweitania sediminis TaxID=1502156 RepID=A0A8J7RK45_9HYPH|nr:hydrogen peroxide-inducible genes activator [Tianweitania sediminis]MBP0438726.1 hydrogen peroxide-inducible genes activator [Tianweitania sediminis]